MGTAAAAAAVGQEADGRREGMGLIQNLPKRERRGGGPESLKKAGGRPCLTAPFCFLVVGETARDPFKAMLRYSPNMMDNYP